MKTLIPLLAVVATVTAGWATGLNATPSNSFRALAAGHGTWVAVDAQGRLLASADRVKWTFQQTGTVFSLYAVAFGNGQFVAVGNEGAILTSTDGIHWTAQKA